MKRLLFALCLLPSLVFGANIDFRNLNTNHFTTNGFRVGIKSIPTNQTVADFLSTNANNGPFILRVDGQGTNTSITNFNVNGAVKRPGTQLVHFAAVDFQLTRTATDQVASGYASLIGPGSLRSSARAIYSVVLNGFDNHVLVTGERSMIGGGQENTNGAPFSSIFGVGNYTSSNSAGNLFITGSHNRAEDLATDSGIIAGSDNQVAGLSTDVFILSSYISRIVDSSVAAIITAESGYITNGSYATIVGGIGNRNFNSTGGIIGGGTMNTLSNGPGSFAFGSSITIRAGNAGGLGFNLTNDIEGTVHMGNGELGNWFYADKTNAYLVGSLKLVQTNAAATAITTAGAVGVGTITPLSPLHVVGGIAISNAQVSVGRVWTATNANGQGTWQDATGSSGGPAGFEDSVPYLEADGNMLASTGLRWIEADRYLRVDNIGSTSVPATNINSLQFTALGPGPGTWELYGTNASSYATIAADDNATGILVNTNQLIFTNSVLNLPLGGVQVGPSGAIVTNVLSASASLNFPDTLTLTSSDLPITVTGCTTNDTVQLGAPFQAASNGGSYSCFTSNNAVWIRFANNTAGSINPDEAVFRATVTKVR